MAVSKIQKSWSSGRHQNFLYISRHPPINFQLARARTRIFELSPRTKHRLARIVRWFASASDCYKKRFYQLTVASQIWHRTFERMRHDTTSLVPLFSSRSLLRLTLCTVWHEPAHGRRRCQHWRWQQQRANV